MPVTLESYDQDTTILIYRCQGDWTWEEFGQVDHSVWTTFHEDDTRFDIIIDMSKSDCIPTGVSPIVHQAGQRGSRQKRELGILIQAPLSIQIIIQALKRMYPEKSRTYVFVETFDEAIQLIQQDREND